MRLLGLLAVLGEPATAPERPERAGAESPALAAPAAMSAEQDWELAP